MYAVPGTLELVKGDLARALGHHVLDRAVA